MLMVFKCIYMCIISKSLIPSILYYTCIQLKTLKSNCDFAVLILLHLFNWKYSDLARILKDFCCNRLRCKKNWQRCSQKFGIIKGKLLEIDRSIALNYNFLKFLIRFPTPGK